MGQDRVRWPAIDLEAIVPLVETNLTACVGADEAIDNVDFVSPILQFLLDAADERCALRTDRLPGSMEVCAPGNAIGEIAYEGRVEIRCVVATNDLIVLQHQERRSVGPGRGHQIRVLIQHLTREGTAAGAAEAECHPLA